MITQFINWLAKVLHWDTMPSLDNLPPEEPYIPASPPPVVAPSTQILPVQPSATPKPTLADFLKWQWQFEGANPAINNPGNFRYFYGGYLPIYGNVKRSVGGFAMFPTLAQGKMYATACTKGVIKHHPELTILTYIGGDGTWNGYAPASDHNPVLAYATFIASHLSTTPSFLMRDLV